MGEGTEDEFYEISAVARLTGLSTHVLRVWEKRYGVVDPDRTHTKRRQYSRSDIHRLTLLKSLVDNGHTISTVANLEIEALEERLEQILQSKEPLEQAPEPKQNCQVGFIGVHARDAVRDAADIVDGFSLVSEFPDLDAMVENMKPGVLDILLVEIGSLFLEDLKAVQSAVEKLSARRAIVVYQFASNDVVEPGNIEKVTALRGPVTSSEILLACSADIEIAKRATFGEKSSINEANSPIPDRMFTPEQLQSISKLTSVVECECPQHLANLLSGLSAFEEYSSRCESINEQDAKLHAYLHQETAGCRHRMELALQHLMESEGISI